MSLVSILVTTARALPQSEAAGIEKQLTKKYPEGVKLQLVVDPSIVGGIRLQVGTTEIDATVITKLETIKQKLLHL